MEIQKTKHFIVISDMVTEGMKDFNNAVSKTLSQGFKLINVETIENGSLGCERIAYLAKE